MKTYLREKQEVYAIAMNEKNTILSSLKDAFNIILKV